MKTLQSLMSGFLLDYLPRRRGFSPNTISSYRDSLLLFLRWSNGVRGVPPDRIGPFDFDRESVSEFTLWLREARGCSASTANNRLAAIKSFMRYCQLESPEMAEVCAGVIDLKAERQASGGVDYLSVGAVRLLVTASSPSPRDHAMVSLLYDSGCRVSELASCTIGDLSTEPPCTIRLVGKGNKARVVPLSPQSHEIARRYVALCREGCGPQDPLFVNRSGNRIGRAGITYVVNKAAGSAHGMSPSEVPAKIHPHMLRHSKAMHMLESGVNLVYIRDFLGHVSVTTTEIYAKANPEVKRKAIEKAGKDILPETRYDPAKRADLEKWLKDLL